MNWRARHLLAAAMLAVLSWPAVASEQVLAEQLRRVLLLDRAAGATDLVLVPPPPAASPLPREEIGRIMERIAAEAARLTDGRIAVRPAGATLRATLDELYARQGMDGWQQAAAHLPTRIAGMALLAEARLDRDGLALRLTVVDLRRGGRTVGATRMLPVTVPEAPAGDPDRLLRDALAGLLDRVPEAAAGGTVLPFRNGTVPIVTRAGQYLARGAADAWLEAANTASGRLRDAAPVSVRLRDTAPPGFRLSGTIWPVDAGRTRLHLALADETGERASARIDIALSRLPPAIAATLDPDRRQPGEGFAPVREAVAGLGTARLELELAGGGDPVYRICTDIDAGGRIGDCDAIRIRLRASQAGEVLCFGLGDDGSLAMLAPAGHWGPVALRPDRWRDLPGDLPPPPGGGENIWYVFGPAGHTLIKCALYESRALMPLDALSRRDGRTLEPSAILDLAQVLVESAPLATASAVVTIAE